MIVGQRFPMRLSLSLAVCLAIEVSQKKVCCRNQTRGQVQTKVRLSEWVVKTLGNRSYLIQQFHWLERQHVVACAILLQDYVNVIVTWNTSHAPSCFHIVNMVHLAVGKMKTVNILGQDKNTNACHTFKVLICEDFLKSCPFIILFLPLSCTLFPFASSVKICSSVLFGKFDFMWWSENIFILAEKTNNNSHFKQPQ